MARKVVEAARLESLLEALQATHGNTALTYLSVLDSTIWNDNHGFIAILGQKGLLPWCITLNFDLLFEEAILAHEGACKIVCPLTDFSFELGSGRPHTTVIKPHGSMTPAQLAATRFDYISTTLSQVGRWPDPRNVAVLKQAFAASSVLLVAGYSDNDWDIYPILVNAASAFEAIVWIDFKSGSDMDVPLDQLTPPERVRNWLDGTDTTTIVLYGRSCEFLNDILNSMGYQSTGCVDPKRTPESPDADLFRPTNDPNEVRTLRTAVSLAMLLQHTGEVSELLLSALSLSKAAQSTPELAWRVEYLKAHAEHTRGRVSLACRHALNACRIKRKAAGVGLGEVYQWLGYEHLCLAKRPNGSLWKIPFWVLTAPCHILGALRYFRLAQRFSDHSERESVTARNRFYLIDLLHTWGSLLIATGRLTWIRVPIFRFLAKLYASGAAKHALLNEEYYWLRHLEARMLGQLPLNDREAVEAKLDGLNYTYTVLQNNVQIGNVSCYRALLSWYADGDKKEAIRLLDRAEDVWREAGKDLAAAERRLALFRRQIGNTKTSAWKTIKILLGDQD